MRADAVFTGRLTYRVDGSRSLLLDVLRPAAAPDPCALVVFVHGGGWHEGDRGAGMHPWLNPLLVAQGFATASITYRLSDEAHWPVPLHDVRAALRWLRAHAAEYGADPYRIGVWGHSAGAHLAALAALPCPSSASSCKGVSADGHPVTAGPLGLVEAFGGHFDRAGRPWARRRSRRR